MIAWGIIITTLTFVAMLVSIIVAPPRPPLSETQGHGLSTVALFRELPNESGTTKAA